MASTTGSNSAMTTIKTIKCHWYSVTNKVHVIAYEGRVSQVICPWWDDGDCTSRGKPDRRVSCYMQPKGRI